MKEGDELTPFRLLVHETIRQLSNTSLQKLEWPAIRDVNMLVAELGNFVRLFEAKETPDRAGVPKLEKQRFYFCATELFKLLFVSSSGGFWKGVDAEMSDTIKPANRELEVLYETYLYFALEAEPVELDDVGS